MIKTIVSNVDYKSKMNLRTLCKLLFEIINSDGKLWSSTVAVIDYEQLDIHKRFEFIKNYKIENIKIICMGPINKAILNELIIEHETKLIVEVIHVHSLHILNMFIKCVDLIIKSFARIIVPFSSYESFEKQLSINPCNIIFGSLKSLKIKFFIKNIIQDQNVKDFFEAMIYCAKIIFDPQYKHIKKSFINGGCLHENDFDLMNKIVQSIKINSSELKSVDIERFLGHEYCLFGMLKGVNLDLLKLDFCIQGLYTPEAEENKTIPDLISAKTCHILNNSSGYRNVSFVNRDSILELKIIYRKNSKIIKGQRTRAIFSHNNRLENLKKLEIDFSIFSSAGHIFDLSSQPYMNLEELEYSGYLNLMNYEGFKRTIRYDVNPHLKIRKLTLHLQLDCSLQTNLDLIQQTVIDMKRKFIRLLYLDISVMHCKYEMISNCLLLSTYQLKPSLDKQKKTFFQDNTQVELIFI